MRSKKARSCFVSPDLPSLTFHPVFGARPSGWRRSDIPVKTAIIQALIMYGIAFVISMLVALLIRGLFLTVRRLSGDKKS